MLSVDRAWRRRGIGECKAVTALPVGIRLAIVYAPNAEPQANVLVQQLDLCSLLLMRWRIAE